MGGVRHQYQIRVTSTTNGVPTSQAITIPEKIAKNYENVYFSIRTYGQDLILESGARR